MATTPNVYEKLQAARVALQGKSIPKSGKNKHAGYSYHELSDFLPHINQIFAERKLCSMVSFTSDVATLTIVNAEKPDEQVTFTSPMAEASLKGVQPIQNIGAVQTYQRRYLYMAALEIVEHDALDASQGSDTTEQPKQAQAPRQAPQPPAEALNDLLDKGRKAYFAEMNDKLPPMLGPDAAKNFAKWMAEGMVKQSVESFNDIPLDILRRIFAHVKKHGPGDLAKQYRVMEEDRNGPDEVPGFEQDAQPALAGVN